MRTATFRKVNFTISLTQSYGRYMIEADYKGKHIRVATTDSSAWDWINDDSNKEKHNDAKRHCYNMIVREYEKIYKY